MAFQALGNKLSEAFEKFSQTRVIDDATIQSLLKSVCSALLQSDVDVKLVVSLRAKCSAKLQAEAEAIATGKNKARLVEKIILSELLAILDPGKKAYEITAVPDKCHVVMFVGLQGAGKTTTVSKFAMYHKRRGLKTAIICADTFRAGAFDQVRQNSQKSRIPFYGSHYELDPVVVATKGLEQFRREGYDLVLVDTSGRHSQATELFEEMRELSKAVEPDDVVLVIDSSMGQTARDQAVAFQQAVPVGSVIVTKFDGHARGGGALSAVAATRCPITFLGTGEHLDDIEPFEPRGFLSRLLGRGDMDSLMRMMQQNTDFTASSQELSTKLLQAAQARTRKQRAAVHFSFRDLQQQLRGVLSMGPLGKIMDMIPGMRGLMQGATDEKTATTRLKLVLTVIDSFSESELDADDRLFAEQPKRLDRVARGAGVKPESVQEVLATMRQMRGMATGGIGRRGGGAGGMPPGLGLGLSGAGAAGAGRAGAGSRGAGVGARGGFNASNMAKMMSPDMLRSMGGAEGIQRMMQQLQGFERGDRKSE